MTVNKVTPPLLLQGGTKGGLPKTNSHPSLLKGGTEGGLHCDDSPPQMSADQLSIWLIIARAIGRAEAISAKDIGLFTGINPRTVRSIVRDLRMTFHKPIGSTTGSPPGYFHAVTIEELKEVADVWLKFSLKGIVMARSLMRWNSDDLLNQVRIMLEEEPA